MVELFEAEETYGWQGKWAVRAITRVSVIRVTTDRVT
jgi:hypothetical protein